MRSSGRPCRPIPPRSANARASAQPWLTGGIVSIESHCFRASRYLAPAAAIVLSGYLFACSSLHRARQSPSLIVLGVDAMDPNFVERHWNSLPNLARLRDQGYFGRLGTTTPPQSPVAWSTFITGLEPGEHGIFDFVHRD